MILSIISLVVAWLVIGGSTVFFMSLEELDGKEAVFSKKEKRAGFLAGPILWVGCGLYGIALGLHYIWKQIR